MRATSLCHFIILSKNHNDFHLIKVGMGIMKSEGVKVTSVGTLHLSLLSDSILLALYMDASGFRAP